jgi:GxxExxY protein
MSSRGDAEARRRDWDGITGAVVDESIRLHRDLGPGLLESVYEAVLEQMLIRRGFKVERQKTVVFEYDGIRFEEGLRVDLLVEGCVVVELKSVEKLAPVHGKQVLTYLKLLDLPVGLLINFGGATLKEGLHRIVNHFPSDRSSLPVNLRASAPPREPTQEAQS